MRRILAVNVGALLILGFGLLYSGQYERELIRAELSALTSEAEMLAAALAEGGVREDIEGNPRLADDLARHMLRKLSEGKVHRSMVFSKTGEMMLDTHQMLGPGGVVEVVPLDPPYATWSLWRKLSHASELALDVLPTRLRMRSYVPGTLPNAQSYPYVIDSINGNIEAHAWRNDDGRILLTVSMPIQKLKNVLGGVLLQRSGEDIDEAVRSVQFTVIKLFLLALLITVLLSAYLSETIARPILRLSEAAGHVKRSSLQQDSIPDFTYRRDEIGILSGALREMTGALADRMDAISSFAADVAHEIKNPLASVKSAVETLAVVKDTAQRDRLIGIVQDDINRLNRLITDISAASRLDSEIIHAEKAPFDFCDMVVQTVNAERQARSNGSQLRVVVAPQPLRIMGNDTQLSRVLCNLIQNGLSFVTDTGTVDVTVACDAKNVMMYVDNDGPAIPEKKLEAIFARFYSERPQGEKFGLHSGLGLSISRQIVHAHSGMIYAENLKDAQGKHRGVRFTVVLPLENQG